MFKNAIVRTPCASITDGITSSHLGKPVYPVAIDLPATLEAGDVMMVGDHFFIGISNRTNFEGEKIEQAGYETIALDVSEFRKIDGGLSCLSLRF